MSNEGGKVVINLATGLEDSERVTVAFWSAVLLRSAAGKSRCS